MTAEQALQSEIIERAWSDPEFKQKLLEDPKATLQESFNITVPDEIRLNIVEETQDNFYLIIPPAPKDRREKGKLAMW
jgi:hypothetical protein